MYVYVCSFVLSIQTFFDVTQNYYNRPVYLLVSKQTSHSSVALVKSRSLASV